MSSCRGLLVNRLKFGEVAAAIPNLVSALAARLRPLPFSDHQYSKGRSWAVPLRIIVALGAKQNSAARSSVVRKIGLGLPR